MGRPGGWMCTPTVAAVAPRASITGIPAAPIPSSAPFPTGRGGAAGVVWERQACRHGQGSIVGSGPVRGGAVRPGAGGGSFYWRHFVHVSKLQLAVQDAQVRLRTGGERRQRLDNVGDRSMF